ncbi:hypothetical protein [Agrobacterium larrymoorei]|uniref:DNA-binding MarR family transcriptional regulator n=1 Tax=Agrobacterium larrymoorei TaxID=160699 RepID=A0ABU0UIC0_9HYPH|nr:hypothetical protein [Agrobacterium larrymoorei]MDQ1184700.1 DNA-binding MarR family transcriptional regulator [Agrobacterium larrymoorei]
MNSGILPFGRREWLEAVCRDPGISALQFRVAYALSGMISAEGRLRARLIEIAARSGTTGPSVRGALFRLAERGFLVIRLEKQQVAITVPKSIPRRTPEPVERDSAA